MKGAITGHRNTMLDCVVCESCGREIPYIYKAHFVGNMVFCENCFSKDKENENDTTGHNIEENGQ